MADHCEFLLASEDDIPEIVNLYHGLIGAPGCAWNADYPDRAIAESDVAGKSLYVLKKNGEIIAAGSIEAPDELAHLKWAPKKPCELSRLGVALSMQNRGVGTRILQSMIATAKEKGFDGIVMLVSKANSAALALYDKNGFEKCGETSMYHIDFYCYQMTFNTTASGS